MLAIYQRLYHRYAERENWFEVQQVSDGFHYTSAREPPAGGERGRPRFSLKKDHLVGLRELGFTWTKIASILGISRSTITRHHRELGLDVQELSYSDITDADLDIMVEDVLSMLPNSGELMVRGALRARGVRIQRRRLREAIWRVDPTGREMRRRFTIQRRVYNVTSPNALWYVYIYTFCSSLV